MKQSIRPHATSDTERRSESQARTDRRVATARRAAQEAGLRYVSDAIPGIRRIRTGAGFAYRSPNQRVLRDTTELCRIKALVIPPAWQDVWICPIANGHLQATGRDARGRKQYRYHRRWRATRDETKYDRLLEFGVALPKIRRRIMRDLAQPGLTREKVIATVVRLLERTLIRVGNEEYARHNHSFGLTTMRTNHVDVVGARLRFEFRGKSKVRHAVDVKDPRLARIVKRCRDLPGHELFQYVSDDRRRHSIDSSDVNEYLRQSTRQDFTSKDFRTWAGTVLAARTLCESGRFESQAQARRNVARAIRSVAQRLGNTLAVCRKCYVHPAVLQAYFDRSLAETMSRFRGHAVKQIRSLDPAENSLIYFLKSKNGSPNRCPAAVSGKRPA